MPLDRRLEFLGHVLEISNSSVDVNERLDSILGAINNHFKSCRSILFMHDPRREVLVKANRWPRQGDESLPEEIPVGQGMVGLCAQDRQPRQAGAAELAADPHLSGLCGPESAAALWPVMDDKHLYAVLVMVFVDGRRLAEGDCRLMQMVARELGGSIRNFRLYLEARRRIAELNALSDLGRAAVSTIEVEQLLRVVADICAKLLGARGGLVHVSTLGSRPRRMQVAQGEVPDSCRRGECCDRHCPHRDGGQKDEVLICSEDSARQVEQGAICALLSFKGDYRGHLCVFGKAAPPEGGGPARGFGPEDQSLLNTMATMVSAALENALTFQRMEELAERNEEMVSALATLYEISTVLMTTVDFNETVEIILNAVTHPAGLDYDRVILFLVDEDAGVLRPVAERVKQSQWGPTRELTYTLLDLKNRLPLNNGLPGEEMARLVVELDPDKSVLARTAVEKQVIEVPDPTQAQVSPQFLEAFGERPFLTVPMFAKGKVVGVLVVHCKDTEHLFRDRDRKILAMLANLGGLSLENSRLYQHLERVNREMAQMRTRLLEADKLAALGEIAAGMAHEIRNPLVSIGGFARRVRNKLAPESDLRRYLDVIIEEVARLERSLKEMLDFESDSRAQFQEHDLNRIMAEALELLRHEIGEYGIKVEKKFSRELPKVYCDERQIKHVFYNLILNAIQAMEAKGGTLTLRSFTVMREGKQFVAGEVRDSGGGIPVEVMHNIFNPFFTTKANGTGLGLSIVHKIVTRHFGQVEVHSGEGVGASFLVILPAAEEGRAYYLK